MLRALFAFVFSRLFPSKATAKATLGRQGDTQSDISLWTLSTPSTLSPCAALLALVAAAFTTPVLANDSEAEWAIGGLVLKQNDAISMDREELFVSATEVKVDYTYTNHSDTAQTVLVSFPLPSLPERSEYGEYGSYPDWSRLDFTTSVDGKPVEWQVATRAVIAGRDVTEQVAAEGFPLEWYQDYEFVARVANMPPEEAAPLIEAGLLSRDGSWAGEGLVPAWDVQTSVVREQVFPAGATVRVSHRYTPNIGGSVGGALDLIGDPEYAEMASRYEEKFCIDDAFMAGFRKRQKAEAAKSGDEWYSGYGETWIGYVLSSGANWRGPIKDFRLVVDKGLPQNLVSFCMDGVKKISPTQFEVRKRDFEPSRDLDILIVQWFSDDQ